MLCWRIKYENNDALRRARLVLGWVTVSRFNSRWGYLSPSNQPPRSTQPGHPSEGRCNDALWLGSEGRYGSYLVAGKTVCKNLSHTWLNCCQSSQSISISSPLCVCQICLILDQWPLPCSSLSHGSQLSHVRDKLLHTDDRYRKSVVMKTSDVKSKRL